MSFRRVILYCNVGWCVKGSVVQRSRRQCLVAEWLGLSVTVRVRAKAKEWGFPPFFFSHVLKVTNTFVLHCTLTVAATFMAFVA